LDPAGTGGGRLILGTAPGDFDPARDIALGPWCFAGVEESHPGWDAISFADPFPTPDAWVGADRDARRLANALVPAWAQRLNARHGRNYGHGFWRVLLMKWLTVCIPPLWQRYRQVEEVARLYRDRALTVTVCADRPERWPVAGCEGLTESFTDPAWDFRLVSAMVARLAPPAWRLETVPAPAFGPPRPQSGGAEGRSPVRRLLGRLPVDSVPGASVSHRLLLSAWAMLLPRRAARHHYDPAGGPVPGTFPAGFLTLLDDVLGRLLPRSFAEDFPALEAGALARRYVPGRLCVDALDTEDDGRRMVHALAHERGERLVSAQHGGIYGTARAMMVGAETEYPYDAFLTWGWTAQEDFPGRFVPVPSPALSRLAGRRGRPDGRLVMVGGAMLVHGTRLGWLPKPQDYLGYRRDKQDFLAALAPEVLPAVHYRPYRRKPEVLRDEDHLRQLGFDLPLVEGDLNRAMLDCRLLVIDHPITTMLAALAADIPTVLLWRDEAWPLAAQAEPLFDGLRRAGILHHDPAAAAAHVNRIWADVPGWWNAAETQDARRRFAHAYARTSRRWCWEWIKALARL
jgi:putative transferase (TIGR04331 family)